MKKKFVCIFAIGLSMALLSACSDNNTEVTESQKTGAETYEAVEAETSESAESEAYGINKFSMEGSTDSEYEINDMLPRPSDDTFIMTVEEAEAFMKKKIDAGTEEPEE